MRCFTIGLIAGLALGVVAIAGAPAAAQKAGGTLVQITQPEPPNLAPYISTSAPISQVTAKVYDGLLEYGFDLKPKASARRVLGGGARRQDRHFQAAQGREVPRRQAVHLRRRAVHHHGGAEEGAPARHQYLPRRHGGRDPRRVHRGLQAHQRRALHAVGPVGLREPDAAQARLRPGRHPHARQRQPADRHGSVQVCRMAARRARAPRQEPGLLAQGSALSRPHRGALHQRRSDAHRGAGKGRGACRRLRRGALQRCQEAGAAALDRGHDQGLRDDQPDGRADDQHQEGALRQSEGASGHRLRDRSPVRHRQHLVRLSASRRPVR